MHQLILINSNNIAIAIIDLSSKMLKAEILEENKIFYLFLNSNLTNPDQNKSASGRNIYIYI